MNLFDSIWRKHKPQETPIPAAGHEASDRTETDASDGWRFIARQAIFDRKKEVFGYELLARSGWENRFTGDSDTATRKMIFDGALYGFEGLTRGRRSFVNCTRESLVDGLVTLLPKTTVLEILETVTPDEQVIESCRKFKELGYQIALDDFRISPAMRGLVDLADYVKVDFRLSGKEERREILAFLKGSKAQLIAEKIETEEEYKTAAAEGFDFFQGYFFCHPTVFSANRAPATGNNYLQLFSAVSQKEFNFVQLAELIKSEVTICYQLLRLVNSAAFGLPQTVESVKHALAIVGEAQFRKLVLNAIAVETCKKHPDELLVRVLHRARFFELLSPFNGENAQEQYLFGLTSLMDVMLDMPLAEVVRTLPLRDAVKEALIGKPNGVATALRLLEAYEDGNWDVCTEQCIALRISESKLTHLYEESTRWAEQAANPEPQRVN